MFLLETIDLLPVTNGFSDFVKELFLDAEDYDKDIDIDLDDKTKS